MRPVVKEFAVIGLLGIVIPWVVFHYIANSDREEPLIQTVATDQTAVFTETAENDAPQREILILQTDSSVEAVSLDDYITGVVLAEMPAEFETEALMAQAVAARTYTLKRCDGAQKHAGANVCTKASCCQAYMTCGDYLQRGGSQEDFEKISSAVKATSDQVLMYDGELIEATYFSCSGGMTEDALAVWGSEIPYLIAQPSPGEESASAYAESVTLHKREFLDKLSLTEEETPMIGEITYTNGDGVDTIQICGQEFTGTRFRELLGLRSTSFAISAVGENVIITTKGFGHRVGMSQYGADAMAAQGSTCEQILAYYYPGTELTAIGTD